MSNKRIIPDISQNREEGEGAGETSTYKTSKSDNSLSKNPFASQVEIVTAPPASVVKTPDEHTTTTRPLDDLESEASRVNTLLEKIFHLTLNDNYDDGGGKRGCAIFMDSADSTQLTLANIDKV